MQFRRSGQRDERRRKVLLDDSGAEGDRAPTPNNKAAKSDAIAKAYATAAVEETETRIADLIPTRPLGVVVLSLLGLTAIAAVQALYTFVPDWRAALGEEGIAPFDVAQRGSINSWLSAVLLAGSAAMSVLIYMIRRHKMDDYRGRYRMWLWAAAALVLASVNTVAGLHNALDAFVLQFAEKSLFTHLPGWSLVAVSFFGGIIGLRVLMDMWRSRGSSVALAAAGSIYAGAAALKILQPLSAQPMLATMVFALTLSLGHLALALALVVYGRRVLLEARGLLVVKKKQPKPKAAKPKETKRSTEQPKVEPTEKENKAPTRQEKKASKRRVKIDPPHRKSAEPAKATAPAKAKAQEDFAPKSTKEAEDEFGPTEGSPGWHKISKSERRRIKKLRRRKAAA